MNDLFGPSIIGRASRATYKWSSARMTHSHRALCRASSLTRSLHPPKKGRERAPPDRPTWRRISCQARCVLDVVGGGAVHIVECLMSSPPQCRSGEMDAEDLLYAFGGMGLRLELLMKRRSKLYLTETRYRIWVSYLTSNGIKKREDAHAVGCPVVCITRRSGSLRAIRRELWMCDLAG
jgi:hypothetical protein